ncbi:MAG: hypothetical protein IJ858_05995 [Acidaminococcaceae bacterium]|nr:hypothetical protein [Acidaminococcaceae bacterium]
MAYLDRWKTIFPETVGSEARPSAPIDDSLDFNTDGFPQFIASDPVRYDLQNAFLMQLFSNDARLGELLDTIDDALENHKADTAAHANGISGNAGSATKLKNARSIDGASFNGTADIVHFGSCSTAAGTVAKTVACAGFTLVTGALIFVKFTVTNTAANPTLNVDSTGAKAIQYRGSAIAAGHLAANRTYAFVYDGTSYQLIGDIDTNTTYSNMTAATASAAGEAGLVPAPAAGKQASFLRGDGTWQVPTDTDTHWTTHLYAGSGSAANASTSNGNTKITVTDNSSVRNSVTVKGSGATTVTSDASGNITIASTNTNNISGQSLNANGYIKFNNGLIIQWGNANFSSSSNYVEKDFPITFSNDCFIACCTDSVTGTQTTSSHTESVVWNTGATTKAKVRFVSAGNLGLCHWIAFGN